MNKDKRRYLIMRGENRALRYQIMELEAENEALRVALASSGGAIGRLERFIESGGDTSILLEGLDEITPQSLRVE